MILRADMLVPHLLLAGAWILWCTLHSLLITPAWIRTTRRMLRSRFAYYRFTYTIISVVTLVPVIWFQLRIETVTYWSWHGAWLILQYAGILVSLIILLLGAREYNQGFFFGIQQIRDYREDRATEFSGLETHGILNRVRHPYYTAGIILLLFWGDITAANIILKVVGISYFILGAFIEERKLVREFGDTYRSYQRRVPMFVPRLTPGDASLRGDA